ncbi:MAG: glycosyltransferase family 4 protein [Candidatus Altiarchaeota archaeon]|nr:glycosyltransferase family 4 protein [Candidatus Altiarchaeota archaeon]
MKILGVAPYYLPYTSGMTVYLKRLAEGLVAGGHQVTVLTTKHEKNLPEKESVAGVEVIRTPVLFKLQRGAFSPALTSRFRAIVREYDVVNIHAPFLEAGLISWIARRSPVKKVFLTYHCDLKMQKGPLSKTVEGIYYLSVKKAAKDADTVIVNSMEYLQNSRMRDYSGKAVAIYPPIDTESFVKAADCDGFGKKFDLEKSDKIVGFVGRLTREKGLIHLVSAMPNITGKHPEARLLIAGESGMMAGGSRESVKDDIKREADRLNLQNVVFTGHLPMDDLVRFYSICSVFVLPSTDPLESFGMVQVEAMLCGCPVVASDMPGVREPVKLTGCGLLAPPGDVAGIACAVNDVLENRDGYAPKREDITRLFGTGKTVKAYERIFE